MPALNEATLLTTVDLLDAFPPGEREQIRAYMSHRIGDFLTQLERGNRLSSAMNSYDPQPGGGDGTQCGRVSLRGAFTRQQAGDFDACPPLDYFVHSADPKKGGKAASPGYVQLKRAGDGNFGIHVDERAKAGYLLLLELTGGSGYAQVNRKKAAPQHVCSRVRGGDGRSFQCGDASHKKMPIAKGGDAVLTQRLPLMVTVARFEANADMTVVTEGEVRLVAGPLSSIRAGHAAFALGKPLQHAWGSSDGPSVAALAASQPYGAVAGTFMISVASFADAMAQLGRWRAGLAPLLPGPDYAYPASCFFFVDDEHMACIRSQCVAGSKLSAEDSAAGGARRRRPPRRALSHPAWLHAPLRP